MDGGLEHAEPLEMDDRYTVVACHRPWLVGNQSQNPPDVRFLLDCLCAFEVRSRRCAITQRMSLPVMAGDTARLSAIH